jgi:L,D-transpeptidase ErfK/SrfK
MSHTPLSRYIRPLCLACLVIFSVCNAEAAMPDGDLIGIAQNYTVQKGDSVSAVARHFDIGVVELLAANPSVTSAKLVVGQQLSIPQSHILPAAPHTGIVINLAELRLFYYLPDGSVTTFPISIGKEGWLTPTGTTEIVLKRKNPTWTPPASIRAEDPKLPAIVPAGPNNPLGQYALSLGWAGYAIHGTNAPSSIGKPSSHGCMRMYPEDIAVLFNLVGVGTPVTIVDTPVKFGWVGDSLYMEVTPTQAQARDVVRYRAPAPIDTAGMEATLLRMELQGVRIDWVAAKAALLAHDGIPVIVGTWSEAVKAF